MNELLALAAELDAAGLYAEADQITDTIKKIAQDPANPPQFQVIQDFQMMQKMVQNHLNEINGVVHFLWNTPDYDALRGMVNALQTAARDMQAVYTHAKKASAKIPLKIAESPYAAAPSTGAMTPAITPPSTPAAQTANPAHIAANRQALSQAMNLLQQSLSTNPAGLSQPLSRLVTEMKQFLQVQ